MIKLSSSCVQNSKVVKIITHKDFNGITKENDIALLKLQTPLVFDECVRPIPVWSGDLPSLKRCAITGWGSTTESRCLSSDNHRQIQDWRTCTVEWEGLPSSSFQMGRKGKCASI